MTLLLNGTTGVSGVDGSATTPAVQGTDTNTGIFFPAADTYAVATGGSERYRVDSSGNINIGTSGVSAKLYVNGNAASSVSTLTYASTTTIDMSTANNFSITLTGTVTFANPTNAVAGQTGSIFIIQDGTGSRTASWGTNWDWASGTAPTLTTTASAVDRVDYIVRTSSSIQAVFTGNYS